jgi:hypothetical protein
MLLGCCLGRDTHCFQKEDVLLGAWQARGGARASPLGIEDHGGGSALNGFFQGQELTAKGKTLWKGEREDSCGPKAYCGKSPDHTFILGTIRNPYGLYISHWQMAVKDGERRLVDLEVKKKKTTTANGPF